MEDRLHLQESLKKVECFSSLDDDTLRIIQDRISVRVFGPGEVIFSEGDVAEHMYIVKSGEVSVLKRADGGPPVEINVLRPGDFGGVTSLFVKEPRSATLQALGRVELWVLDGQTFQSLLESSAALCNALLTCMSRHLRNEWLILARLHSFDKDAALNVAVFDAKPYTKQIFSACNEPKYALAFFDHRLTLDTASSAMGFKVVCAFVNDELTAPVIARLKEIGVEMIAMRCAGYNNVDLQACERAGISVARVPAYSPHSIAEHAIALVMTLNRKIFRAHARVREGNFSLDGLVGFEIHGKTVGVIGTGRIGKCAIDVFQGFGCEILAYDKFPDAELAKRPGVKYVDLDNLLSRSDIITLHAPLMPETRHIIDATAISKMKQGVMIINTSRGGLIDTQALIDGLKTGHVGSAGLDVYEEESEYFFQDFSDTVITDDVLARLMTFNNVLITSHMAFLTYEALANIADTTFLNIREYEQGKRGTQLTYGVCPKCAVT